MLAANHKPYFIIIKNRHCRVLNESGLPDWPGSLAPARQSEDNVVLRLAPTAGSGGKAVRSVAPVQGGAQSAFYRARHALLGGWNVGMDFRSDGGKDSGA
ncbi:hypothetical protein SCA50_0105 [Salmonella enterica subsp. enterica serovar Choleraesuis str. SCSA50]|uniref:Uncharacterized protein n=2 Tax=Salmonella enterica subsp. enterica serovar Choleraesuis TaxID=119912 RepID=Q57TF8_SALCH|nr:hypothetical protein SCH_0097 [Salmonella enterica subsp. enterica serovar Choleraesuis str. SC-B67]EFZ04691.1 hypothetical protein SCA50_0105 [Salmonella enterica subsp. enterica serovar Choleraesuis str. SCSA50]